MTEKELIATIEKNQKRIDELTAEISNIRFASNFLVDEFINNEAKYKVGDVVNIIAEKYKVPRKYFVKEVWGFIEQQDDKSKKVQIQYGIETSNGYKPNRGWSLNEKELKLAK